MGTSTVGNIDNTNTAWTTTTLAQAVVKDPTLQDTETEKNNTQKISDSFGGTVGKNNVPSRNLDNNGNKGIPRPVMEFGRNLRGLGQVFYDTITTPLQSAEEKRAEFARQNQFVNHPSLAIQGNMENIRALQDGKFSEDYKQEQIASLQGKIKNQITEYVNQEGITPQEINTLLSKIESNAGEYAGEVRNENKPVFEGIVEYAQGLNSFDTPNIAIDLEE